MASQELQELEARKELHDLQEWSKKQEQQKQKEFYAKVAGWMLLGPVLIFVGGTLIGGMVYGGAKNAKGSSWCAETKLGTNEAFLIHKLKQNLRNPDSFQKVSSGISNMSDEHVIALEYRAENGFGGMNVGHAYLTIDNSTCKPTDFRIDE